ncbi:MAG: carboxypeptidase regulatory-like domain-containing protein [Nitrososphaerota archaeon]
MLIFSLTIPATEVHASPGWDFVIDLIASNKSSYNIGETAQIFARIQNTGTEIIDSYYAQADFTVYYPDGSIAKTGTDWNSHKINPGNPDSTYTFTLNWLIPSNAQNGYYDIKVVVTVWEGVNGQWMGATHVKSKTEYDEFSVNAPPPSDFYLSITPSSRTISQGETTTYQVTANSQNGWNTPVTLSVSGLPSGASATFNPNPITPTATSTLTISTSPSTPTGVKTITVTGTGGSKSHTTSASLTIQQSSTSDFNLVAYPDSLSFAKPSSGSTSKTSTITITSINGFNSQVSLSAGWSGTAPSGVTYSLSKYLVTPPVNGQDTSTLTVTVSSTASTGIFTLLITGISGSLSKGDEVTITITPQAAPLSVDVWSNKGGQGHNVPDGSYQVGETVTIWYSVNKACTAKITITKPDGSQVIYGPGSVSAGTYSVTGTAAEPLGQREVLFEAWTETEYANDRTWFTVVQSAGNLQVIVRDQNGNAIPGVDLISTSQPIGQTQLSGTTDQYGQYTWSDILTGSYVIQAVKIGYNTNSGSGIVNPQQTTMIAITLATTPTRSNPSVMLIPESQFGIAGSTMTYTVYISNTDDPTFGPSTFSLTYSVPSGWTASLSKTSVTITPWFIDSSVTLSVTIPSSAPADDYIVSITATNMGATSYQGIGSHEIRIYSLSITRVQDYSPIKGNILDLSISQIAPSGNDGLLVSFYIHNSRPAYYCVDVFKGPVTEMYDRTLFIGSWDDLELSQNLAKNSDGFWMGMDVNVDWGLYVIKWIFDHVIGCSPSTSSLQMIEDAVKQQYFPDKRAVLISISEWINALADYMINHPEVFVQIVAECGLNYTVQFIVQKANVILSIAYTIAKEVKSILDTLTSPSEETIWINLKNEGQSVVSGSAVSLYETGQKLYIHIYDELNRHVGLNYEINQTERGIAGTTYIDKSNEIIIILPVDIHNYRILVDSSCAEESYEEYNLTISTISNGQAVVQDSVQASIEKNSVIEYEVRISEGKVVINPVTMPWYQQYWYILPIISAVVVAIVSYLFMRRRRPEDISLK